jgi:hypothetical protein
MLRAIIRHLRAYHVPVEVEVLTYKGHDIIPALRDRRKPSDLSLHDWLARLEAEGYWAITSRNGRVTMGLIRGDYTHVYRLSFQPIKPALAKALPPVRLTHR